MVTRVQIQPSAFGSCGVPVEPEGLQQARDQNRDQAVKGGDARLVAVLEALSRHRITRIEQGERDEDDEDGPEGRGSENGADDEAQHDADNGENDGPRPIFGPVDAPIEGREEILKVQIHRSPSLYGRPSSQPGLL